MKSQLFILQFVLVSYSLLATNANLQCDKLLHHCNQLKAHCSPDTMTLKSCCDLTNLPLSKAPSGVYQIMTNCSCGSPFAKAVDVYCNMDTAGGGWMVIQRNKKDGADFFSKTWREFEEGFGDLKGDKLWYGLKALNCFTERGIWELRIDFQFENKTWSRLHYKHFKVGSCDDKYPLTIGGFTGTTPTDPFMTQPLNGIRFSTIDNDNDRRSGNCAAKYGGWWHNNCFDINLNKQPPSIQFKVHLRPYELLSVEMKIRQQDCISL